MNTGVEFHDSWIRTIISGGADVTVRFSTAYVHMSDGKPGIDSGSVWVQELDLSICEATVTSEIDEFPRELDGGEISLGDLAYENVVPLPLDFRGNVALMVYSIYSELLTIRGTAAKVVLHGEPEYVEQFPGMIRQ